MRKLFLAALVAATASPTFAQDPGAQDRGAPGQGDEKPFNGPRAGVIVGYDGLRPGSSVDSDISGDDAGADGVLYGGDIGYDWQHRNIVFGVEDGEL